MSVWRVALSGGICSGKSTVCGLFSTRHQVPVIDADHIGRGLLKEDRHIVDAVTGLFGEDILDDRRCIDRKRLRSMIFSDPASRKKLEDLLHPVIYRKMEHCYHALVNHAYCIFCIPLLFETGRQREYDHTVIVDSPPELQLQRLMHRNGCGRRQAEEILRIQIDRSSRAELAGDIVYNGGELEALVAQVDRLHERYREISARSGV